jgi:uncharacterized protein (TIGR00288 family)
MSNERKIALFIDFENIAIGVTEAKYKKFEINLLLERLLEKGKIVVKRAYCDWDKFPDYKRELHEAAIEMMEIPARSYSGKNSADIRMAVDAMETLIVHPEISVFILVSGDGDYSPLVQRLREFGKWVVGVGTEANASRKLVSVCSEYKYWGTLVAEVEPAARPTAAFDIADAERLLVRALEESGVETMTAGGLKSKMLALDPAFDEHNYGARSFRAFLAMLPKRVEIAEVGGPDLTVKLIEEPRKTTRTRTRKS